MSEFIAHPPSPRPGSSDVPPASVSELQNALARPVKQTRAGSSRRAVAVAAALVAVAALVAASSAALSRQQAAAPGNATPAAPVAQPLPTADGSGDDTAPVSADVDRTAGDGAEGDLLSARPEGVEWELFEGVAVPMSQADGPSRANGPIHGGFSRTPTGALLAAAQIGVRRIVTPDINDLRAVNEQQLLPGPGRTAFLDLIANQQDNTPPPGGYGQTAVFQMLAFTPDVAVLSLATRSPRGVLQSSINTLRWTGGDWKVQLPPSGLEQPRVLADLTGFVPWSGVS